VKRKRWTKEEQVDLGKAFRRQIEMKTNITCSEIRDAKKKFKSLHDRPEAVIRSKINNIILGKTKFDLSVD
jgi:hypothetical protein